MVQDWTSYGSQDHPFCLLALRLWFGEGYRRDRPLKQSTWAHSPGRSTEVSGEAPPNWPWTSPSIRRWPGARDDGRRENGRAPCKPRGRCACRDVWGRRRVRHERNCEPQGRSGQNRGSRRRGDLTAPTTEFLLKPRPQILPTTPLSAGASTSDASERAWQRRPPWKSLISKLRRAKALALGWKVSMYAHARGR